MRSNALRFLHLWPAFGRIAVGFFFLTSAYLKLTEGFFFLRTSPLAVDFQYWLDRGWTFPLYRPVLEFFMPYADFVAVFVIAIHAVTGVFFLLNYRVRLAGILLFILQFNILLATCLGWGFLVMVGCSLWIALYFVFKPSMSVRAWRWLTLLFIIIYILMIYGRFVRGDPWVSHFPSHFVNFQEQVMGVHPILKKWVIELSTGSLGPWLWVSMWWIQCALALLLFTRYRLFAGVLVGVVFAGRAMMWMNVMGAEAVVYMLLLFLWLAEEAQMQSRCGIVSLFPREDIVCLHRSVTSIVSSRSHRTKSPVNITTKRRTKKF